MQTANSELAAEAASSGVLTRHQLRKVGYIPQVVNENGDYRVKMIRDDEGLDQSGTISPNHASIHPLALASNQLPRILA